MITLAVDCMGGDHGPRVTLAACRQFLGNHPDARLLLVGLADSLKDFSHDRATIVPATEVVAMDDPVEVALRRKKTLPCAWPSSRSRMELRGRRFLLAIPAP